MNQDLDTILNQFNHIFIDVLDEEDITLKLSSTAEDVDEWDSLTHVQLVVAIEKHFKVKFTVAELEGFKDVGAMCQGVLDKLNG